MILLVVPTLLFATASEGRLGFTDRQILALGRDRWIDYYHDHRGSIEGPTVSGFHGDEVYGRVLRRWNDRALARIPGQERLPLIRIRKDLYRLEEVLLDTAQSATNVGFLWPSGFQAGIASDAEQAVSGAMGLVKRPRSNSPAIDRALSDLASGIREVARRDTGRFIRGDRGSALKNLILVRAFFHDIAGACAKLPARVRGPIYAQCLRAVKESTSMIRFH